MDVKQVINDKWYELWRLTEDDGGRDKREKPNELFKLVKAISMCK